MDQTLSATFHKLNYPLRFCNSPKNALFIRSKKRALAKGFAGNGAHGVIVVVDRVVDDGAELFKRDLAV